jgi:predicted DNA-binding transcriptional regulator AlpA
MTEDNHDRPESDCELSTAAPIGAGPSDDHTEQTSTDEQSDKEVGQSAAQCDEPLVIDAVEFAQMIKVSSKTIDRRLQRKELPKPIVIGRQRRWRRQEIVDWIAAGAPSQREWERQKAAGQKPGSGAS